jgi:hypothetical protein
MYKSRKRCPDKVERSYCPIKVFTGDMNGFLLMAALRLVQNTPRDKSLFLPAASLHRKRTNRAILFSAMIRCTPIYEVVQGFGKIKEIMIVFLLGYAISFRI